VTAGRALYAFRPAQRSNGINADLLIGVVSDGLLKCLWRFHGFKVAH
jgi:hypothetical protein